MDLAQLEEIFHKCCSVPPQERQSVIDAECAHEPELARMVSRLLAALDRDSESRLEPLVARETKHRGTTTFFEQTEQPPAKLSTGTTLAGRYEIEAFIAAGGMGQVYRVRDQQLGVILALKTIRPEVAAAPRSLRRFKQEMLLARSISHPNVCRIFDLDHDEATGVAFITMEYLDGETLADYIDEHGRLDEHTTLSWVREMADALDAAHRAGIVHRDFKSPNVMLVRSGDQTRVVVTDFGLATTAGDADNAGIVGTPAYMAPEQAAGRTPGPRADLYSLGVVLFEMCTGELPFRGASPLQTARAQLTLPPPRPSALAPVDEHWEAVILRLLAKAPADRYDYAVDVIHDLEGRTEGVSVPPHVLPAELDAFVGRDEELGAIRASLETPATSLLTLRGPGGTGKSRLARKYGWESLLRWPGGLWFCDLHEARSLDGITGSVAATLDVPLGRGDAVTQLGYAIAARERCLVILDNFEQVVEQAQATLGAWLTRAPLARFLVTSRERLGLSEEEILELEPLDPETRGLELFEVRAWGHRPAFLVDLSNRQQIGEIVRKLDGLPLAIELAASRLRMLSPEELSTGLADRFEVLTGGNQGRHATLQATLDWSWDLLQPWEQSAIAQMSMFEGGFDLEAAESVLDLPLGVDQVQVIDTIQSLVDKSWLRTGAVGGQSRFSMYSTIQEYARNRLSPRQSVDAERRHGNHFSKMGQEDAIEALSQQGGTARLQDLHIEQENLIAACRRALERKNQEVAALTYVAAASDLVLRGPLSLAVHLGNEVLGILEPSVQMVHVLHAVSAVERYSGNSADAQKHGEEALELSRRLEDPHGEALAHGTLAFICKGRGEIDEAIQHFEDALRLHRATGHRADEARVLGNLGSLHYDYGKMDEARTQQEAALAIHQETGNRRDEGIVLGNLANLLADLGEVEITMEHYELALECHRESGNRRHEAMVFTNLGIFHQALGHFERAGELIETALRMHGELGARRNEGVAFGVLGYLRSDQGRHEEARELLESAIRIHRESGNQLFEGSDLSHLGRVLHDLGRFADARACYEDAIAVLQKIGDRGFEGSVRNDLGELEIDAGDLESAQRHFETSLEVQEVKASTPEALTWRGLGHVHRLRGQLEEARSCFERSISMVRDLGDQMHVGLGLCGLGLLEVDCGHAAEARAALEEASRIAEELGLDPEARLVRATNDLRTAIGR